MLLLDMLDAALMETVRFLQRIFPSLVSVMLSATTLVTVVMTLLSLTAIKKTVS